MGEMGRLLIIAGAVLIGLGLLLNLLGWLPGIGRLPGDIYIKRDNLIIFIPITSMIIFSIIISLILRLFR